MGYGRTLFYGLGLVLVVFLASRGSLLLMGVGMGIGLGVIFWASKYHPQLPKFLVYRKKLSKDGTDYENRRAHRREHRHHRTRGKRTRREPPLPV